jgi:hypothetical protein
MDLREKRLNGLALTAALVTAAGLTALISGCAGGSGPEDAFNQLTRVDYGQPYIGMSKAEVLSCAGQPRSTIAAGPSTETLVYHYNGGGPVPGAAPAKAEGKKKKSPFSTGSSEPKGDFTCTASLTFEQEKLVRVSYAHMQTRSPYDWQKEKDPEKREQMREEGVPTCVFSLPRCPR